MSAIARTPSHSHFIEVRGLTLHVRAWRTHGADDRAPALVLLHGWMDVSASFQFVVDALKKPWRVFAPDWRGFGLSGRTTTGPGTASYWFPDYFADLESILDTFLPDDPVHLVGHSMGGNVACIYAGIRPQRVTTLTSLDGMGLPAARAEQAPSRYARWLDALRSPETMRTYGDLDAVADRLKRNNPRLSTERAQYLARHWARCNTDGQWEILGDPAHKLPNPVLYRVDEILACWQRITAPVLWVEAAQTTLYSMWARGDAKREHELRTEYRDRLSAFRHLQSLTIEDAGHMLHHDQPERVAQAIEDFIESHARTEPASATRV
ncbi:MAG TPA: alpha/beta hydrolase [Burkholderiaceae bacterium]|nr:alpha/beta hydrolase [Burkholderiaceae bacterium]